MMGCEGVRKALLEERAVTPGLRVFPLYQNFPKRVERKHCREDKSLTSNRVREAFLGKPGHTPDFPDEVAVAQRSK